MCSIWLFPPSSSVFIVETLSTSASINKENIISTHLYKAVGEVYWNRNVKCMYFPPERVLLLRWQCDAWIKIVSINAGRWNANKIKSVWPIQQSSAQMPISLLLIMGLMRNHSVRESPNLCKHTVSIDLFGGDMSLLGLARHLRFSCSIKDDLRKTQSRLGLWKQSQPWQLR